MDNMVIITNAIGQLIARTNEHGVICYILNPQESVSGLRTLLTGAAIAYQFRLQFHQKARCKLTLGGYREGPSGQRACFSSRRP